MKRLLLLTALLLWSAGPTAAQGLRIALVKQPFSPTGQSQGPTTMAEGGIQGLLRELGATTRGRPPTAPAWWSRW